MKKSMTMFAVLLALVGCKSTGKKETETVQPRKSVIVYYSQTGGTEKAAKEFAKQLDLDTLIKIEVENPYDGTYDETIERCMKEMETGEIPTLKSPGVDVAAYDTVYLGYPIWFGTYAPPVKAFVKEVNLDGKVIVPFCTFGSGGRFSAEADLKTALPNSTILPSYGVRAKRIDKAPAEITRFLILSGILKGEAEQLPEYSQQQKVTPEDVAVFNAACGDYPMPLGTPVTVGKRETSNGTDYQFVAKSKDREGKDMTATIYVTVGKEEGSQPEFTEVVR